MPSNTLSSNDSTYKLCIQLSDTHLFGHENGKLLGVNTQHSLSAVVDSIQKNFPTIDALVATGDISQDQSLESYQTFKQITKSIHAPSLWLPGNHDDFSVLGPLDTFNEHLVFHYDLGENWRIIMLNSQVEGESCGWLAQAQLDLLSDSLQSSKRFHVICLHHPPFVSSASWLAGIGLTEPWSLLDRLECHLNANVVLCGHIHQVMERYYRGMYLLSCPSTCVQFAPVSKSFKLDNIAPGYRWLKLYNNSQIETGIVRLEKMNYTLDNTAEGY